MRDIRTDRTIDALAFSPDSRTIASGGWKHVALWDLATGECTEIEQNECLWVPRLGFSADGSHLVWICQSPNEIRVADLTNAPRTARKAGLPGSGWELALLPNGKFLTGLNGVCSCWAVDSLTRMLWPAVPPRRAKISIWQSPAGNAPILSRGKGRPQTAFNMLAKGTLIARLEGRGFTVWQVGGRKAIFTESDQWVRGLAFTPDGRLLIGCVDRSICYWETHTWRICEKLNWDIGHPECVAVSPDGLTAAASGSAGDIMHWDIGSVTWYAEGETQRPLGISEFIDACGRRRVSSPLGS